MFMASVLVAELFLQPLVLCMVDDLCVCACVVCVYMHTGYVHQCFHLWRSKIDISSAFALQWSFFFLRVSPKMELTDFARLVMATQIHLSLPHVYRADGLYWAISPGLYHFWFTFLSFRCESSCGHWFHGIKSETHDLLELTQLHNANRCVVYT